MAVAVQYFRSVDGRIAVGCGEDLFSVHVLRPYPGWVAFKQTARPVVAVIADAWPTLRVRTVAVRYIDRIVIPPSPTGAPGFLGLESYFTIVPSRPARAPQDLANFRVTMQSNGADGIASLMTIASSPRQPGDAGPAVVYDLHLQQEHGQSTLADGHWEHVADALHHRQRLIFEDSITDSTRELFR